MTTVTTAARPAVTGSGKGDVPRRGHRHGRRCERRDRAWRVCPHDGHPLSEDRPWDRAALRCSSWRPRPGWRCRSSTSTSTSGRPSRAWRVRPSQLKGACRHRYAPLDLRASADPPGKITSGYSLPSATARRPDPQRSGLHGRRGISSVSVGCTGAETGRTGINVQQFVDQFVERDQPHAPR